MRKNNNAPAARANPRRFPLGQKELVNKKVANSTSNRNAAKRQLVLPFMDSPKLSDQQLRVLRWITVLEELEHCLRKSTRLGSDTAADCIRFTRMFLCERGDHHG